MMEVQVVGGRELAARFRALEVKVQRVVMKAALDAAAEEAQGIASDNAPSGEGTHGIHLADSIEWKGTGKIREVGPSGEAFWGRFVEVGTGMRTQRSTGRKTGFARAQPYLAPTADDPRVQQAATRAFLATMEVI